MLNLEGSIEQQTMKLVTQVESLNALNEKMDPGLAEASKRIYSAAVDVVNSQKQLIDELKAELEKRKSENEALRCQVQALALSTLQPNKSQLKMAMEGEEKEGDGPAAPASASATAISASVISAAEQEVRKSLEEMMSRSEALKNMEDIREVAKESTMIMLRFNNVIRGKSISGENMDCWLTLVQAEYTRFSEHWKETFSREEDGDSIDCGSLADSDYFKYVKKTAQEIGENLMLLVSQKPNMSPEQASRAQEIISAFKDSIGQSRILSLAKEEGWNIFHNPLELTATLYGSAVQSHLDNAFPEEE